VAKIDARARKAGVSRGDAVTLILAEALRPAKKGKA